MPDPLIVVGVSSRALAVSAARSGFAPLSIDMFGDLDTRAASLAMIKVAGDLRTGLDADDLTRAVALLVRDYAPVGLVYGSAFDHDPEMVLSLSRRVKVFGNDPVTLRRAKDPVELTAICESLDIRCPQVSTTRPAASEGWLVKLQGGAGGAHVRPFQQSDPVRAGYWYFQRRLRGRSHSILFLADGRDATLVGYSRQWTSPTKDAPFRYGGAAGPVPINPAAAATMFRAADALTEALGLKGLNSADFIVSDEEAALVDLNPRPGATLDVFDTREAPLVARHIAACEGRSGSNFDFRGVRAAEVVYAPDPVVVGVANGWPDWLVDRSPPGTSIPSGAPLCTVLADGPRLVAARVALSDRAREARALFFGDRHNGRRKRDKREPPQQSLDGRASTGRRPP